MNIDFVGFLDPEDNPLMALVYFLLICLIVLFLGSFILEGFSLFTLRIFSILLVFFVSIFFLYKSTCRYMFVSKKSFEDYLEYIENIKDDNSSDKKLNEVEK